MGLGVVKPTLTPAEAARVEKCMGPGTLSTDGERICRCGVTVPWTPDTLWRHTLACEPRQKMAAERDRVRFERERDTVQRQIGGTA